MLTCMYMYMYNRSRVLLTISFSLIDRTSVILISGIEVLGSSLSIRKLLHCWGENKSLSLKKKDLETEIQ